MKPCSLYQISFPNGKIYIGLASNPYDRFESHKKGAAKGKHNWPVQKAIRKHGAENVEMRVLAWGPQEYIYDLERKAIAAFSCRVPNGYNLAYGGHSAASSTPEARAKIRESKLKHWNDPAYRARMLATRQNQVFTKEYAQKHRELKIQLWQDPERRSAYLAKAEARRGVRHTEEHRAKQSAGIKATWEKGREARIAKSTGRRHFTNGVTKIRLRVGETHPEGFVPGFVYKEPKSTFWINDGTKNKILKRGAEVPAGFVVGFLSKPQSEELRAKINAGTRAYRECKRNAES